MSKRTFDTMQLRFDEGFKKGRNVTIDEVREKLCDEMDKHSTEARPIGWSRELDVLTLDNVIDIIFDVTEKMKGDNNAYKYT